MTLEEHIARILERVTACEQRGGYHKVADYMRRDVVGYLEEAGRPVVRRVLEGILGQVAVLEQMEFETFGPRRDHLTDSELEEVVRQLGSQRKASAVVGLSSSTISRRLAKWRT
jgi:hypothetical protein